LESTLRKLGNAILDHQQNEQSAESNQFARRLVAEHNKNYQLLGVDSSYTMDSMKKAVFHLTAAQQEKDDMSVVVMHLKSAIGKMNTVMNNSHQHGRRREVELESGTATFQESVMGLAKAVQDGDSQAFFLHMANVQQGIQMAIAKLHAALEEQVSTEQEMQDLGKQLAVVRNNANVASLLADQDLVATATVVTNALGHFLDETSTTTRAGDGELAKDLAALVWILPVSMVAGTFFWAFAGIWEYRGEFTPFEIWVLEILWVMDNIACAIGNEGLCLTDGLF
jgi:hypothetical protein